MGNLETLKAIGTLSLLADDIKNGIHELSTLSVVSFGPVVASTALTEDKVVRAEKITKGTRSNRIHGARFEVNKNSTGNILVGPDLVVVNVDTFKLKVIISLVKTIPLNAVLVRDNFPEFGTNLVTTLASLQMDDLTHD
jgi:hypothetical protein